MNRIALPLALVLTSSASFAQSAQLTIVRPERGETVYTTEAPLVLRTTRVQSDKQGELGVWMGLSLQPRKDGPERLEVLAVIPGSPAERAGAKPGDKLVALAGRPVTNHDSLHEVLSGRRPGDRLQLTVERSAKIKLSESTDDEQHALLGVNTANQADTHPSEGVGRSGLAITNLTSGMAAESSGLVVGERICAIDGKEIGSFSELQTAILSHDAGDQVEVRTQRDLTVELAPRPAQAASGRAVAGMGGHAFGNGNAPVPAQPGLGGAHGLFTPQPNQGEGRTTTPGPLPPHAGPQAGKQAPQPRLAIPFPPSGDSRPRNRGMAPGDGEDGIRVQLLEEIRALRKEVAELRRQIDAMRDQKPKNAR